MPLYISLGKIVEIDESMFGIITKTTKVYIIRFHSFNIASHTF